jgi:glycosyltransferase involved in cell wall biosynthesis
MGETRCTILGLFLYKEIRTGGHRRYLELMEGMAARGHTVRLLVNENLSYSFSHLKPIYLTVKYTQGQRYPVSLVFKHAIERNYPSIQSELAGTEWILIFSETNLSAAGYLKKKLNCKLLYGHRSNAVQEALQYKKEHGGKNWKLLKYQIDYWKYRWYEGKINSLSEAIVFQSRYDQEDYLSRNPSAKDKSFIIGGHIGPPRFKAETAQINHSTSLRRLLFIGTTGPRKGLQYLLEALVLLKERGIDQLELDVVGPGDTEAHLSYLKQHGLLDKVRFHGRVADPFPFMQADDLMVIPSIYDSYPNTVLEALHTGIPVIASAVGGIPEMLQFSELLFPPGDAKSIAEKILNLVSDPQAYIKLRTLCAHRLPAFHFDWEAKWEEVIVNLR